VCAGLGGQHPPGQHGGDTGTVAVVIVNHRRRGEGCSIVIAATTTSIVIIGIVIVIDCRWCRRGGRGWSGVCVAVVVACLSGQHRQRAVPLSR
jgi:hypothetical protein